MSLLRITLSHFVIVKHLELELSDGFTALTGETGAGKSILIDALQLALGGRADAAVVKTGEAKAEIWAEFSLTSPVKAWLSAMDMNADEASVVLRRSVDAQGRSRGWINSSPASATQLRELGSLLLDIHGQHAWQGLMKPDTTRELLDEYGRTDSSALAPLWLAWKQAKEELRTALATAANAEADRAQLTWQMSDLEKLAPTVQGWSQLQEEHARLANVHGLIEGAQTASDLVSEQDESISGMLSKAYQVLAQRQHLEPQFTGMLQTLEQAAVLVNEAGRDLQAYLRHTEADPERLAEVEQRMSTWMGLSKRHRCAPEDLPQHFEGCRQRLAALSAATDIDAIRSHVSRCEMVFMEKSKEISTIRHVSKQKLATEITSVMQRLGMAGGAFDVRLNPLDTPQASGLESVEFLVAGHAGAELRPVTKVASGGELSRIALAIAVVTSQLGGCATLIFDEVDSGVGGAVAHTVGQLMAELGHHRQVLAVTHLPQVASCADHHLRVSKAATQGDVVSQVTALTTLEREQEIARMLGGASITEASLNHAREMLAS
jgi:DNA repair protein RecN (Recombination protein N)